MHNGDLINEETIVPGGEKPVGSSIKGHGPQKTGVPARGAATPPVKAGKDLVNTDI